MLNPPQSPVAFEPNHAAPRRHRHDALDTELDGLLLWPALGLLLLLSWLLAEFVLPLLFTAGYYVVSRGLRRVANDTHDCQGDLPRALGWSVAWATLYTLPFALVVFLAQGLIAASR